MRKGRLVWKRWSNLKYTGAKYYVAPPRASQSGTREAWKRQGPSSLTIEHAAARLPLHAVFLFLERIQGTKQVMFFVSSSLGSCYGK